jgi:hypothetical protein
MYTLIVLPFFLQYLTNAKFWPILDLLRRNPHRWSPIILCIYGLNLQRTTLDGILYEDKRSDIPRYLLQIFLLPFLQIGTVIDCVQCWDNSCLFQGEWTSLWNSDGSVLIPSWVSLPEFERCLAIDTSRKKVSSRHQDENSRNVQKYRVEATTLVGWLKCDCQPEQQGAQKEGGIVFRNVRYGLLRPNTEERAERLYDCSCFLKRR